MPGKPHAIKSDLTRVDRLRDEDIDYGDVPELDDDVFAQPLVPWPPKKEPITIRVDADVLDWFKREGRGYQTRINQVLRRYMDVTTRRAPGKARRQGRTNRGARRSRRP
jgi:uncharacterized protein (DUF4415 family)